MFTVISLLIEHVNRPDGGTPFLRGIVLLLITNFRVKLFVHLFIKIIKVLVNFLLLYSMID
jgi:hypothetical protein